MITRFRAQAKRAGEESSLIFKMGEHRRGINSDGEDNEGMKEEG
jgi:hypothetical protein